MCSLWLTRRSRKVPVCLSAMRLTVSSNMQMEPPTWSSNAPKKTRQKPAGLPDDTVGCTPVPHRHPAGRRKRHAPQIRVIVRDQDARFLCQRGAVLYRPHQAAYSFLRMVLAVSAVPDQRQGVLQVRGHDLVPATNAEPIR